MTHTSPGLREPAHARGCSLWLLPEPEQAERLSALVDRLAARWGTPSFVPHVTLLSGFTVLPEHPQRLVQLCAGQMPVRLPVRGLGGADAYFRSVAVELPTEPALLRLRNRAMASFGKGSGGEFAPHLSLLYGWLDAAARHDVLGSITDFVDDAIRCDALALTRTEGPPEAWRELARVPLASPSLG